MRLVLRHNIVAVGPVPVLTLNEQFLPVSSFSLDSFIHPFRMVILDFPAPDCPSGCLCFLLPS